MKKSYTFVDMGFVHSSRRMLKCLKGYAAGEAVKRSNGTKVKTYAATTLVDDILIGSDTTIWVRTNSNGEATRIYGEINANGVLHHFMVNDKKEVTMLENDFAGRYHIFATLLARHIMEGDVVFNAWNSVVSAVQSGGDATDAILDFTNSMWYNRLDDAWEIDHGALHEADIRAFFDKGYQLKYGCGDSDFEIPVPAKKPSKTKTTKAAKAAATAAPVYQTDAELWEDACAGKHIVNFDFDEEVKGMIWPLDFLKKAKMPAPEWFDTYRLVRGQIAHALGRIAHGDMYADTSDATNINMMSIPGTGKSFGVLLMAAALGFPVGIQNVSEDSDKDEFLTETEVDEGAVVKVTSASTMCHKYGGFCLHEELDLAKPGKTKGALGQRLEFPYVAIVTEKGKKVYVHRHALCIYVATMNTDENGVNFDPATATRYAFNPVFANPDNAAFIDRLTADGASKENAEWVKKLWDKVQDMLRINDAGDVADRVSFRHAKTALNAMQYMKPDRAIKHTFYGAIYQASPEMANMVWAALQSDTVFCHPPV